MCTTQVLFKMQNLIVELVALFLNFFPCDPMLVLIACAMNTMIIFFQPPNICSDHVLHRALNAIIIGTFAFDITLKIGYEGMKVIFFNAASFV